MIDELLERANVISDNVSELNSYINSLDAFTEKAIETIEEMIQSEVDRLNKAKGLLLENKLSCKLYGDTDSYAYQQECADLWNWSVIGLYEPMKAWQDSLDHIPTEEEFYTELMNHKYDVIYPEETK